MSIKNIILYAPLLLTFISTAMDDLGKYDIRYGTRNHDRYSNTQPTIIALQENEPYVGTSYINNDGNLLVKISQGTEEYILSAPTKKNNNLSESYSISLDRKLLAVGCSQMIHVFDITARKEIVSFETRSGGSKVLLSPSGNFLLKINRRMITIFDILKKELTSCFKCQKSVDQASISLNEKYLILVSNCRDGINPHNIYVYDFHSQQEIQNFEYFDYISRADASFCEKFLIVVLGYDWDSINNHVYVHNLKNKELVATYDHNQNINVAYICSKGKEISIINNDGSKYVCYASLDSNK